jgi:hypothetical protein
MIKNSKNMFENIKIPAFQWRYLLPLALLELLTPATLQAQCMVSFNSCPGNHIIIDCDDSGDEPFDYPPVSANPNGLCAGFNLVKVQGPPKGASVPLGIYQVAYQAQGLDANQQVVATALCIISVSVVADVQPPVFTYCPPNITVYGISNGSGGCTAQAYWPNPVSTDNCGSVNTSNAGGGCGSLFPMGTNTVTYTSTDPSNNTATCSFTVTVLCTSSTDAAENPGLVTQIYPSPNNGQFTVSFDQVLTDKTLVKISDPSGRVVLEQALAPGKTAYFLDMQDAAASLYFLQVFAGDRVLSVGKFIKQL